LEKRERGLIQGWLQAAQQRAFDRDLCTASAWRQLVERAALQQENAILDDDDDDNDDDANKYTNLYARRNVVVDPRSDKLVDFDISSDTLFKVWKKTQERK